MIRILRVWIYSLYFEQKCYLTKIRVDMEKKGGKKVVKKNEIWIVNIHEKMNWRNMYNMQ